MPEHSGKVKNLRDQLKNSNGGPIDYSNNLSLRLGDNGPSNQAGCDSGHLHNS